MADTPGLASMLMYNNSTSPVSLVCDPSHNITYSMDLLNNSPSLNDHRIPCLFGDRKLFKRSIGLMTLWLELHTSDIGLAEFLYVSMEAGPGISAAN